MSLTDPRPSLKVSELRCVTCGYNLTGATIGGACPECGEAIEQTIAELREPKTYKSVASACFWCGLISVLPLAWFLIPVVVVFFVHTHINVRKGIEPRLSLVRANIGFMFSLIGLAFFIILILR
jgi:predicted RNA-binding Zn-ribbon protein involved in translation (DUF1610 family)